MEKLHSPEKTTGKDKNRIIRCNQYIMTFTGSTFGRNSLAIVLVYDPLVGQTEGADKEPP